MINFEIVEGREIMVHINPSNVRFRGTNLEPGLPVIINAEGTGGASGEVHFIFEQPNKTLQFTSRPDSDGCKFYIVSTAAYGAPRVLFQTPHASNQIIIGANGSLLGMKVGGLTNAIYDGFVFNVAGVPHSSANLVIKSFGSIGLQTMR